MTLVDVVVASAICVVGVLLWHILIAAQGLVPKVKESPHGIPWQAPPSSLARGISAGCLISLIFWGLLYLILRAFT